MPMSTSCERAIPEPLRRLLAHFPTECPVVVHVSCQCNVSGATVTASPNIILSLRPSAIRAEFPRPDSMRGWRGTTVSAPIVADNACNAAAARARH